MENFESLVAQIFQHGLLRHTTRELLSASCILFCFEALHGRKQFVVPIVKYFSPFRVWREVKTDVKVLPMRVPGTDGRMHEIYQQNLIRTIITYNSPLNFLRFLLV